MAKADHLDKPVPCGTCCWKCNSDQPGKWNSRDPSGWARVDCDGVDPSDGSRTVYICSRACYGEKGEVLAELKAAGWKLHTLQSMAPALPPKPVKPAPAETQAMAL